MSHLFKPKLPVNMVAEENFYVWNSLALNRNTVERSGHHHVFCDH